MNDQTMLGILVAGDMPVLGALFGAGDMALLLVKRASSVVQGSGFG